MSITRVIGTGMAWNTGSTILGKILIFGNVFLILRYLSVYQYGLSELVLSVISTMSIALLPGLTSAVIADLGAYRGNKEYGEMKGLFSQYMLFISGLGVLAWAILFFGSSYIAELAGNVSISYFLKIAAFFFLTSPLRTATFVLANVELRFMDQSLLPIVEELFKFLLLMVLVVHFDLRVDGLLLATVLADLAVILIFIPRTRSALRVFSHAKNKDGGRFWRLLHEHRKWSVANSYIGTIGQTIQIWLIRLILGTEAVGLFAFATGAYGHAVSLLSLGTVLGPVLPRYVHEKKRFVRLVRSSLKAQVALAALIFIPVMVGAPVLALIFPKYKEALPLLWIVLFALVPNGFSMILTPTFYALKEQYQFFITTLIKVIFAVISFPICMLAFGESGMAIAFVLVTFATAIERYFRIGRIVPEIMFTLKEFFTVDRAERTHIKMLYRALLRRMAPLRRL